MNRRCRRIDRVPPIWRVSVVIPTYNRRAWIGRALDSVLAQSAPPIEIIVVDDGSDDDTAGFVKAQYPDVRLIEQPNRGVSAARNVGIELACGDWIALLDSDDAWRPQKLERQYADKPLEAQISHCDEIWIRNGNRVNPKDRHQKHGGWIYPVCLPLCAISPSAVVLERRLVLEIGGFDESLPVCEDYDLWLRLCARHPVHFLAEPLVTKYGGHADQLSKRYWGMDRFRMTALEKILAERCLDPHMTRLTLAQLIAKIDVYLKGAKRRRKHDEIAQLSAQRERALARCRELDTLIGPVRSVLATAPIGEPRTPSG